MSSLFRLFGTKSPAYNKKYKETLFDRFTIQGGSTDKKKSLGALFETNYEFMIYGFFLGLYQKNRLELPVKAEQISFRHEIENWGSKRRRSRGFLEFLWPHQACRRIVCAAVLSKFRPGVQYFEVL